MNINTIRTAIARITPKEIYRVDYSTLDTIIQQVYNRPDYEVVAFEEMNNDSSKLVCISKIEPLDKWQAKSLEKFKQGSPSISVYTLLQDLVNNEYLNPGNYLIEVSW